MALWFISYNFKSSNKILEIEVSVKFYYYPPPKIIEWKFKMLNFPNEDVWEHVSFIPFAIVTGATVTTP